jgi:hypothetical protein
MFQEEGAKDTKDIKEREGKWNEYTKEIIPCRISTVIFTLVENKRKIVKTNLQLSLNSNNVKCLAYYNEIPHEGPLHARAALHFVVFYSQIRQTTSRSTTPS